VRFRICESGICLSVGFAAAIGRCDVKGMLAGRISWAHPSGYSLFEEPQDRSAVLDKDPQPRRLPQHREIDSAKTKTREENIDAITHMLIVQRRNRLGRRSGLPAAGQLLPFILPTGRKLST